MKRRLRFAALNGTRIILAASAPAAGNGKAPITCKDATDSTCFGIKSGKYR